MKELIEGDRERELRQTRINFDYIFRRMNLIHDLLCPDMLGTWQERVDQCVDSARKIAQEKKREKL